MKEIQAKSNFGLSQPEVRDSEELQSLQLKS